MNILGKKNWQRNLVHEVISLGDDLLKLREKIGFTEGEWSGTQFKSRADQYAHSRISRFLNSGATGVPIVSEEDESGYKFLNESLYWLVDPIDGTRSYCEGFDGFVIQLCLMKNSRPIWSCIHAPAEETTYIAERGEGAFVNGVKSTRTSPPGRRCLIDNYPSPKGICKKVYDALPATDYLESGSLGLKICKVADGQADIFIKNVELKIWDIAPAELFLNEMGGSIVDFRGNPLTYIERVDLTEGLVVTGNSCDIESILNSVKIVIDEEAISIC